MEDGDDLGDDIETCFPSSIPEITMNRNSMIDPVQDKGKFRAGVCGNYNYLELVRRYLGEMILNPGILQIRCVTEI